jgi:hypothetical protein
LWLIPVVALAIVGAAFAAYRVSVVPPELKSKSLESGAAKLGLVLDSKDSTLSPQDVSVGALAQRSVLYAELLTSQPVRKSIGERTHIQWQTISIDGQVENQASRAENSQPNQVQRSVELVNEGSPWRVYFTVNSNYPIINLYAQAPTARAAINLVQGAADSLVEYTSDHQRQLHVPISRREELLQLGEPQGGVVAPGANASLAVAVALAILLVGCFLILYLPRVVSATRQVEDGPPTDWLSDDLRLALEYQYRRSRLEQKGNSSPHEAESARTGHRAEGSRESRPPL